MAEQHFQPRVVGSERFLAEQQGLAVKLLGLGLSPVLMIQPAQVSQHHADLGMVGPQRSAHPGQSFPIKDLGPVGLPLPMVDQRQRHQRVGPVAVPATM